MWLNLYSGKSCKTAAIAGQQGWRGAEQAGGLHANYGTLLRDMSRRGVGSSCGLLVASGAEHNSMAGCQAWHG
jgi:hypothetical protein